MISKLINRLKSLFSHQYEKSSDIRTWQIECMLITDDRTRGAVEFHYRDTITTINKEFVFAPNHTYNAYLEQYGFPKHLIYGVKQ